MAGKGSRTRSTKEKGNEMAGRAGRRRARRGWLSEFEQREPFREVEKPRDRPKDPLESNLRKFLEDAMAKEVASLRRFDKKLEGVDYTPIWNPISQSSAQYRSLKVPRKTRLAIACINHLIELAEIPAEDRQLLDLVHATLAYVGGREWRKGQLCCVRDEATQRALLRSTNTLYEARGEEIADGRKFRGVAIALLSVLEARTAGAMYSYNDEGRRVFGGYGRMAYREGAPFPSLFGDRTVYGGCALDREGGTHKAIKSLLVENDPKFGRLKLKEIKADLDRLHLNPDQKPPRGSGRQGLGTMLAKWFEVSGIISKSRDPDGNRKRIEKAIKEVPHIEQIKRQILSQVQAGLGAVYDTDKVP